MSEPRNDSPDARTPSATRHGSTAYGHVPLTRETAAPQTPSAEELEIQRKTEMRRREEARGQVEKEGIAATIQKVMRLRPVRAFLRYGSVRGNLLAGGISITALVSLAAALTIAWTVFMSVLGHDQALREQVISGVNQSLPGLLQDGSGDGLINPDDLVMDTALTPATVIAALVLLWTATSLMSGIRMAVQNVFGIVAPPEGFVVQKLRDLFGFIVLGLGIGLSSVISTAASTLGSEVMGWIGLGDAPGVSWLLRIVGLLVAVLIAALLFMMLFRVTAAARVPRKDLLLGSLVGGVAIHLLLTLGTSLVAGGEGDSDPLLQAGGTIVVLVLWINLLSRVLLIVAAITANPPLPLQPKTKSEVHFEETPNYVSLSEPATLAWAYQDVTGAVEPDPTARSEEEHREVDAMFSDETRIAPPVDAQDVEEADDSEDGSARDEKADKKAEKQAKKAEREG